MFFFWYDPDTVICTEEGDTEEEDRVESSQTDYIRGDY